MVVKIRIQGLTLDVWDFTRQLEKDGYEILKESHSYRIRNTVYVRKYIDIKVKEQDKKIQFDYDSYKELDLSENDTSF